LTAVTLACWWWYQKTEMQALPAHVKLKVSEELGSGDIVAKRRLFSLGGLCSESKSEWDEESACSVWQWLH